MIAEPEQESIGDYMVEMLDAVDRVYPEVMEQQFNRVADKMNEISDRLSAKAANSAKPAAGSSSAGSSAGSSSVNEKEINMEGWFAWFLRRLCGLRFVCAVISANTLI
jgi:hypothetical protein